MGRPARLGGLDRPGRLDRGTVRAHPEPPDPGRPDRELALVAGPVAQSHEEQVIEPGIAGPEWVREDDRPITWRRAFPQHPARARTLGDVGAGRTRIFRIVGRGRNALAIKPSVTGREEDLSGKVGQPARRARRQDVEPAPADHRTVRDPEPSQPPERRAVELDLEAMARPEELWLALLVAPGRDAEQPPQIARGQ